jgi:hypothetical protein
MNSKIDAIIDSINKIERAQPPAFFETRLKARMKKQFEMNHFYIFSFKKPAYVVAALFVLLCTNVYLLSNKPIEKNTFEVENHQSATIDTFNSDYQLINNSSY